jgi:heme A synthase
LIRRLAAFAAFATVVLIVAGGVVTNTDSGLACPDWPTCYGSVAPKMVGNVAVEHTHRLIATAVGLCTVVLVILTLKRRQWLSMAGLATLILGASVWAGRVKFVSGELPLLPVLLVVLGYAGIAVVVVRASGNGKLAAAALGVVMLQGLLGGLTVLYRLPPLVLVMHLGTSMIFFTLALLMALRTNVAAPVATAPRGLLWLTALAVYAQILLGATVRHLGAGLICVDLPYCRGAIWPTNVHPLVHLHMAHRAFAFIVLVLVTYSSYKTAAQNRGGVRALAIAAPLLVLLQIALGMLTILTFKDLVPLTGHLLVGALLLGCEVSLLALTRSAETAPAAGTLELAT